MTLDELEMNMDIKIGLIDYDLQNVSIPEEYHQPNQQLNIDVEENKYLSI